MSPLTADDVMTAIDTTARHLPELTVTYTEDGPPLGRLWAVDPDTTEVYVDGDATPNVAAQATLDGLHALCRHHDVPCPGTPLLRVLPQHCDDLRTGTHGGH